MYVLPANQPGGRPYRGGSRIAEFRGNRPPSDPCSPEDFIASTTEIRGGRDGSGLTMMASGHTLRELIETDPIGILGPTHVECFGNNPMLLVKLLDTAERLFVHYHPSDRFAGHILDEPRGKTEAWIVLEAPDDGYAAVGFSRPVTQDELIHWVSSQDSAAMLTAMNRIPISPGDALFIPAGLPHALGPGLLLVELQQPTDLSIILEYGPYQELDRETAFLGLDLPTALSGLDRRQLSPASITGRHESGTALFPAAAEPYFVAEQPPSDTTIDPGFAVMIVTDGAGELRTATERLPVHKGMVILIRHDDGQVRLNGPLGTILCRPPRADPPQPRVGSSL